MTDFALEASQAIRAIERAQTLLVRQRPGHGPLIVFYAGLFLAQEQTALELLPAMPALDPERIAQRADAGMPLLALAEFPWEPNLTVRLLQRLCQHCAAANPGMRQGATALSQAMSAGRIDGAALCQALLQQEDNRLQRHADSIGVDLAVVTFLAYHALRPSLCMVAKQISHQVAAIKGSDSSMCPICGTPPGLALLNREGERQLVCGFCWHAWMARRRVCPYCGNADSGQQHYVFAEQEPEYRVDLCDGCNRYLKTIDLRRLERPAYLALEHVASLHWDLKAQEAGYRRYDDWRSQAALSRAN